MGCNAKLTELYYAGCLNIQVEKNYTFENGECYRNGELYGMIQKITDDKIVVEVISSNKYLNRIICTFHLK